MPRRVRLQAALVAAALLAWASSARGQGLGAHRVYQELEGVGMTVMMPWPSHGFLAIVDATRTTPADGGPARLDLEFFMSGQFTADGWSRYAHCEIPPASLQVVRNGAGAGNAVLDVDLRGENVRCGALSAGFARLRLRFVPNSGATEGSRDLHSTRVVESAGSRYHVETRDLSWHTSLSGTIDGRPFAPFASSSVAVSRTTRIEKAR